MEAGAAGIPGQKEELPHELNLSLIHISGVMFFALQKLRHFTLLVNGLSCVFPPGQPVPGKVGHGHLGMGALQFLLHGPVAGRALRSGSSLVKRSGFFLRERCLLYTSRCV